MKNSYTNEKVVLSKYPSGIAKKENFSVIKEAVSYTHLRAHET